MRFNINYNIIENKLYISCNSKIEAVVHLYKWDTTFDTLEFIYKFEPTIFDKSEHWFQILDTNLYDYNGIKVEIKSDDCIIKEEFIRFKSRYGGIIKKQTLIIPANIGVGDLLTCTPVIRKMSQIYNQKIDLYTWLPEVFINNPYVDKIIKSNQKYVEDINCEYIIWDAYNINYTAVDSRQMCAWNLGFQLEEDELNMEFYPDPYIEIPNLPEKFICISPSVGYTDRTWDLEKWQTFINLIEKHIPVVAIGKDVAIDEDCVKTNHSIKISNGLNLLNQECQNNLSQAFHIINKSETFVTMNGGLYILALCSDAHITELATPWNTEKYRVRNGVKNFKLNYIEGKCKVHCTSNLKLSVDEYRIHRRSLHVHHNTPITESDREKFGNRWWCNDKCYLEKPTYECHPTPEQVYTEVLKKLND